MNQSWIKAEQGWCEASLLVRSLYLKHVSCRNAASPATAAEKED